jgi:hypothetical protein
MKTFAVTSILALVSTTSAFVVGPWSQISSTALTAKKTKAKDDDTSNKMDPAKRAALDGVLNQIERSYGRGSIVKLGDADNMRVESFGTGALTLDAALGGGYPKGRIIEIYGPESSGKTTLALHAIAECQRTGGTAAFVDAEHALDPLYGRFLSIWEMVLCFTYLKVSFFRANSPKAGSRYRQSSCQPARLWRNGPRYCR